MDCETMLELLSASLDGELTSEQETQLQAHLDKYPNCRALLAELAELHEACGEMEVLPPTQLKEQIMTGLPARRSTKVIYWKRWGALAATLAIVAMAAWRLPHSFFQEPAARDAVGTEVAFESAKDTATSASQSVIAGGISDESAGEEGILENAFDASNGEARTADVQKLEEQFSAQRGWDDSIAPQASFPADQPSSTKEPSFEDTAAAESTQDIAVMKYTVEDQENILTTGITEPSQEPVNPYSSRNLDQEEIEVEDVIDDLKGDFSSSVPDPAFQVPVDFSHYRAVITLTEGTYEGDFLRQNQDNGDVWYLLPCSVLYDDALELRQLLPAYELRQEGEDLTPDAPNVLLIVPAAK